MDIGQLVFPLGKAVVVDLGAEEGHWKAVMGKSPKRWLCSSLGPLVSWSGRFTGVPLCGVSSEPDRSFDSLYRGG